MKLSDKQIKRMANMTFDSIYPHYINKVEKKEGQKGASSSHRMADWI